MHGSDPLDHDPAAEDVTVRDLISVVHSGSVGSRISRAQAAVELTGLGQDWHFGSQIGQESGQEGSTQPW
jgi:hypothetical protein